MEQAEKSSFRQYASVVLDFALDTTFDYGIPEHLENKIIRGSAVIIPLKSQERNGYVLELKEKSNFTKVSPIKDLAPNIDSIPHDLLDLALWISEYYLTPLSSVLNLIISKRLLKVVPKEQFAVSLAITKEAGRNLCKELRETSSSQSKILEVLLTAKKKILLTELLEKANVSQSPVDSLEKKGMIHMEKVRLFRSPLIEEEYFPTLPKVLEEEQKKALDHILPHLEKNLFSSFLLHGVTGSGKTEVYLQAIEKALSLGKGTIMLVPEISLTVQTIERFRSRFEGHIAILHHKLSDGERFDEWSRIKNNEAKIVIGARSALFSPVNNLGLIIIDEEHDSAYKQTDKMPCYHARDTAVVRAKMTNSVIILGSATPSLESYHNALIGKYHLLSLSKRAGHSRPPCINLVDMNKEYEKNSGFTLFSERLIEGIKKRLPLGEQIILFLNRRGYHTTYLCEKCGFIHKCSSCDISLTFHYDDNILSCHLCGFKLRPPPLSCPSCNSQENMKYKGIGTELVERSLHALFPEIRTLRIDTDTTRHKGSYENLFRQFRTGKADVLIGTQMIAKGLHFPSVTMVAILNCDGALHIPDFRSSETVFQQLTQVAGRAGRGELPGEVIIQTRLIDNSTIQMGMNQEFEKFFQNEIQVRKLFQYPPFTHFVKFLFEGEDSQKTEKCALSFRDMLKTKLKKNYALHPVLPSGYPKIKNIFRFQFLVRGVHRKSAQQEIFQLKKDFPIPKDIRLTIDVDPFSTFF